MVFFNCNRCSEALKGNKVEGHSYKCNFATVTCVDCLKDFDIVTFKSHKTCLTEDQRYGGKNYVQKALKGRKKQEDWLNRLQNLISSSKFSKDIENYLNRISNYDNIPRKRPKFINFVKSSIIKDERIAEKLWTIIEQALKPVQSEQNGKSDQTKDKKQSEQVESEKKSVEDLTRQNINSSDQNDLDLKNNETSKKRTSTDVDSENKRVKPNDLDESSLEDEFSNQVIESLIERSKNSETLINPAKLAKKVLKRRTNREMKLKKFKKLIRRLGPHTEFKDLPIAEFYNQFIAKLNDKHCFVIDNETICYKLEC